MVNAECSTPYGGRCRCNPGHFQDGAKCFPLVPPGDVCLSSDQCVHNAVCTATLDGSKECEFSVVCVWGGGGRVVYHWRELPEVSFLLRQTRFCRDRTRVLSRQKYACGDKYLSRETRVCCDKGFVATSILLLRPNTFVAAKMILVTAPSSDS